MGGQGIEELIFGVEKLTGCGVLSEDGFEFCHCGSVKCELNLCGVEWFN